MTYNRYGLLPCIPCLHDRAKPDPHAARPYFWERGQAWMIICGSCKHEVGRETTEGEAREKWNAEMESQP